MNLRTAFVVVLVLALVLPAPAQQISGPSSGLVSQSGALKVIVIQGEGAQNSIRAKTATQPVVEVRDENDKPVAGAEVVFQLPAVGPGGVFHGWMRTQTVRTNEQGQAAATGLTPNDEAGRFNIKVTATAASKTGSVVVGQSNLRNGAGARARSGRNWKTIVAIVAVAAIAGGIYAAAKGDDEKAAVTNPVTIAPGPITVGGPR